MKTFISGATGYLGQKLAMKLAENGEKINVLVRNKDKSHQLNHSNISIFSGDILDSDSIKVAMEGCEQVFHVAALARAWSKDPNDFYTINVEGTKNMIQVAEYHGIKKFVQTSSTGTIGPSLHQPNNEDTPRWSSFNNDYEISKHLADQELLKAVKNGFPGMIAMPSRIYGPGLESPSSGVNRLIKGFLKSRVAIIPRGNVGIANYAYIDDVVHGHIMVREKGEIGEKYILGGENVSIKELFNLIQKNSPSKGLVIPIPNGLIKFSAMTESLLSKIIHYSPRLTVDLVKRLLQNAVFDSSKAIHKLNYEITPLDHGIQKTIQHYLNTKT